jgi:predicted nucleic acid-binding protein
VVYLVDTNVLLRLANRNHPLHPTMRAAVRKLRAAGHSLMAASQQNFVEFWNVATRPAAQNGMGWTLAEADRLLRLLERLFLRFSDAPAVYTEWRLVVAFGVSGAKVHDGRLVATMRVHAATHILTLNTADFARYAPLGIVAIDPQAV